MVPKGTVMYRTTVDPIETKKGQTYVTYLDEDRSLYKGGYIRLNRGAKEAYEQRMVLKEDLKIPSRKEVEEVIQQKVMTNQKLVSESVKAWIDELIPPGTIEDYERFESVAERKKFVEDTIKSYPNWDLDVALKNHFQSFGMAKESRTAVINELKKRGYNAMTDEAGAGVNVKEGIDPLIIFDSKSSLDYMGSSRISSTEEVESRKKYNQWVSKARKKQREW